MQGRLPSQTKVQPWLDWCLRGQMLFLQLTASLLHHCSTESFPWLSSNVEEERKIHNSDHGWWPILKCSWHSKLPLIVNVFIWRVLIGGLPLGFALQ